LSRWAAPDVLFVNGVATADLRSVACAMMQNLRVESLRPDRVHDVNGQTLSGGDSVLCLHRLFGDSDGDGDTDTTDLAVFRNALNKHQGDAGYLAWFDFDGNGIIDTLVDYAQFRLRLGKKV